MHRISEKETKETLRDRMKRLTTQEVLSLVGIAILTPILALGILVSARASAVAEHDLLLFVMALCGAVVSGVNGFGRRTIKARLCSEGGRTGPQPNVALHP